MNPQYPGVMDALTAYEHGLLTKAEARAVILEFFPAAKRLQEALVLAAEKN